MTAKSTSAALADAPSIARALVARIVQRLSDPRPAHIPDASLLADCRDELRRLDAVVARQAEALRCVRAWMTHNTTGTLSSEVLETIDAALTPVPPSGTVGDA